jgi:hypothetical protein
VDADVREHEADTHEPRSRRRFVITTLGIGVLAVLLLAGTVVLAAWLTSMNEETAELPQRVERVFPGVGDGMLRQGKVGLDVQATYYCSLVIDDVVIPDDQLEGSIETGECYYRPGEPAAGEDKAIEEFAPGMHTARAEIYGLADPDDRFLFTWDFEVL